MTTSRFWDTDPNDPDAPVVLDEWHGLRPGMTVTYSPRYFPGPFVLTELVEFPHGGVEAILNDGAVYCAADSLDPEPTS